MTERLTASQENYLEHILRLGRSAPVRVRDIALAAGVRLPSVTKAIARLVDAGLARHEAYGRVEITESGLRAARSVVRRDECLTRLLVDVLAMSAADASSEVCRLEHTVGSEVLARLEILVDHCAGGKSARWLRTLHTRLRSVDAHEREEVLVGAVSPHIHAGKTRLN